MSEYAIHRDGDGEVEGCDCCGCDVATSLFDKPMHLQKHMFQQPQAREDQFRYCEVCSATLISSAHGYPSQHIEDGHLLICLAQCTNMILEAIRERTK